MPDATISFFIDTNCFIQLRDLADLPWQELAPAHHIVELVVADAVISELDRFKNDSNRRRRDRSRMALKLIESASEEKDFTKKLKLKPFELRLRIASGAKVDWSIFPTLDSNKADDKLVATAACEPVAGERQLISYDSGPLIRARIIGLKSVSSPESWQLQEERTEETIEVTRLRRENEALRATSPTLETRIAGTDNGEVVALLPILQPLPKQLQDRLSREILNRNPEEDVRATSPYTTDLLTSFNGGISTNQVQMYQSAYRRFRKKTEKFAADFHDHVAAAMRFVELNYTVRNTSIVTASKVVIRYEAEAAMLFDEHDLKDAGANLIPPKAPKAPGSGDSLSPLIAYRPPREPPRDPTGFYWLQRPERRSEAALTCDELRPGKEFTDQIWIVSPEFEPFEGYFDLSIDASNMSEGIQFRIPIQVNRREAEWTDSAVLSRLPDWISEIILHAEG